MTIGPLHHILYLTTASILLMLCLIVTFRHQNENRLAKKYLQAYLFSFFLAAVAGYIVLTPELLNSLPHFFRTAHFFYSLVMPFSWLYFREILQPGRSSWKDSWLFLPSLLYLADFMPVFLQTAAQKRSVISSLTDYGLRIGYTEGLIMPEGGYHLIRSIVSSICWILQAHLFFSLVIKRRDQDDLVVNKNWLQCILYTGILIFLPSILTRFLGRTDLTMQWSNFAALLAASLQGYFLVLQPELLYGPAIVNREPENNFQQGLPEVKEERTGAPAYFDHLTEDAIEEMKIVVTKKFEDEQIFLQTNLKLTDLVSSSGINAQKWSAFFHKTYHIGFNDYINKKRIEHCITKLQTGEYHAKTLEALAHESGFHSRSTFLRAFKKLTGITPSEFVHAITGAVDSK
jgi:AraC-like DNA-binding protein